MRARAGPGQHPAHTRRAARSVLRGRLPAVVDAAAACCISRPCAAVTRPSTAGRPGWPHSCWSACRRSGSAAPCSATACCCTPCPRCPGSPPSGRPRCQPPHPRFRQRRPPAAVGARLRRRGHRTGRHRPADRLPAHPVRRLQPPGTGGHPAAVPGPGADLGTGAPGPAVARRHRDRAARAVPVLGAARRGHGGEPLHVPRAAGLPLTAPVPQLAGRTGRRDGRGGPAARAVSARRPIGGPARAARRLHRPARHRPCPGASPSTPTPRRTARSGSPSSSSRRRWRCWRRRASAARTRHRGGVAALQGLAGQLRGDRLRVVPPLRRRSALWTGPRDFPTTPVPPRRPADRRPADRRPGENNP